MEWNISQVTEKGVTMVLENKLSEVMTACGVSDEELAYLTGLTRMTIHNAKSGKGITLVNARKIARILKTRVSHIWPEENSEERAA